MQRVLLEAGFNCPQPVLNIHGQDNCLWKLTTGSEPTMTSGSEPPANTENNNCKNYLANVSLNHVHISIICLHVESTAKMIRNGSHQV